MSDLNIKTEEALVAHLQSSIAALYNLNIFTAVNDEATLWTSATTVAADAVSLGLFSSSSQGGLTTLRYIWLGDHSGNPPTDSPDLDLGDDFHGEITLANGTLTTEDRTPGLFPAAFLTKQILPGTGSIEKYDPCIICECNGTGEEDPPFTGNYWIECEVRLEFSAVPNSDGTDPTDNPRVDFSEMLRAIREAIQIEELAETLSGLVDGFAAQGVVFGAPTTAQDENGLWKHAEHFRLLCCNNDLD